VGRGLWAEDWVPQSRSSTWPPADAPGIHWMPGPQSGSPIWRQRHGSRDEYSWTLSAGPPGSRGEAHKGPEERAEGGGREWAALHIPPLPGRRPSHGEVCRAIVRARRTCHTPDGHVLSRSLIGGQSEGMQPAPQARAPSVPSDRGHQAGIEHSASQAQPPLRL
jgi:hypothetical protein